jgi:hypothetical protein
MRFNVPNRNRREKRTHGVNVIDFGQEECMNIASYLDPYVSNELSVGTN